ncbi:MAG: ImmA/IrrE family metallo-endopeptidase [Gammaproteobacteria bacterium]|nr:ImmA/IrrE family metallo-endopeptidase [Gammaproteobacteria bacterium]
MLRVQRILSAGIPRKKPAMPFVDDTVRRQPTLRNPDKQHCFPFLHFNGPQINANFRLNSICNHAFVFLLFRVRIGNFHAANGGGNAAFLRNAIEQITAERVGERRHIRKEFLFVRIQDARKFALVFNRPALGHGIFQQLFQVAEFNFLNGLVNHQKIPGLFACRNATTARGAGGRNGKIRHSIRKTRRNPLPRRVSFHSIIRAYSQPLSPTMQPQPNPPIKARRADSGGGRARNTRERNRYPVKPEIVRWARKRAGLGIADLQDRFPDIKKWERGEVKPTFGQLEKLGKATHTPYGCFFMDEPFLDEYPVPHHCTRGKARENPSVNMLDTIYQMQRRQACMREYLVHEDGSPLAFFASAGRKESPGTVAAKMRKALGFSAEWAQAHANWQEAFLALRDGIQKSGVIVVTNGVVGNNTRRRLDANEFRGFVLADEYATFIFLNNTDPKASQMLTLAHAFAHVLLGESASFNLADGMSADDAVQQVCGKAAAEFLVPKDALKRHWDGDRDRISWSALARELKVSQLVAARRALDLGFIKRAQFCEFHAAFVANPPPENIRSGGWGDRGKKDLRVGRRFAEAVAWALRSGEIQYTYAYRLTGLWGKSFDDYVGQIRYGEASDHDKDVSNVRS